MQRTTNNSLATTMFESDSEIVPSSGAAVVSPAGPSVLQAAQNISTSSDALAQVMSKAWTDSLPGIRAALHNHNAIPSQPAPPNSNSAVISTLSPASLTQASLGQATSTGTFIVPPLVSTFSTLSTPAYGFSFLPLPSGSGSPTIGGWGRVSLSRHLRLICCGRKRFCNWPRILPHSSQVGNQNHNWSFCRSSGSSPRQPQSERLVNSIHTLDSLHFSSSRSSSLFVPLSLSQPGPSYSLSSSFCFSCPASNPSGTSPPIHPFCRLV